MHTGEATVDKKINTFSQGGKKAPMSPFRGSQPSTQRPDKVLVMLENFNGDKVELDVNNNDIMKPISKEASQA